MHTIHWWTIIEEIKYSIYVKKKKASGLEQEEDIVRKLIKKLEPC